MLTKINRIRMAAQLTQDATEFDGLFEYQRHATLNGYYGGLRLLQAVCKKFAERCAAARVAPQRLRRNFTMSYDVRQLPINQSIKSIRRERNPLAPPPSPKKRSGGKAH